MLAFLTQNAQNLIAICLVALLMAIRALVRHQQLRADLRGAAGYLITCLILRGVVWAMESVELILTVNEYLRVLALFLFCIALIRMAVGGVVWLLRSRRGIPTPKIVRDVLDAVLYAVCLVVVLRTTLHFDVTSLIATSAAVSVVIGLALQETLGNLFAGLSLQLEHPFYVGDWIAVHPHLGRVVQVAWRGTKLETLRREQVTVPNAQIAKASVVNYSRHGVVARDLTLGLDFRAPPNQVKRIVQQVLSALPGVAPHPPSTVTVLRFDQEQVIYEVRIFCRGFDLLDETTDALYSTLWYRFRREGFELSVRRSRATDLLQQAPPPALSAPGPAVSLANGTARVADTLDLLEQVDFLHPLGAEGRAELASHLNRELYGRGEVIIRAGDQGDSFHVVAVGQVAVLARVGAAEQEVAKLGRGDFFGEMSLLTGEPRSATVVATADAELVTMSRAAFAAALEHHPTIAHELADILGRRRAELNKAVAVGADGSTAARDESSRIFHRLCQLFKVAED